jgi:E1 N-terminal domain
MALAAGEENAKTLAALLGVDEAEAANLLDVRVLVTYDSACKPSRIIAESVITLISRTISGVTERNEGNFAAELVLGTAQARHAGAPTVWVSADSTGASIGTSQSCSPRIGALHGALALLTSCYASALIMAAALHGRLPLAPASIIELHWAELFGSELNFLSEACDLGEVFLAGAGAVGNSFLYALQFFHTSGVMYICDPKNVMPGALNRCLWFSDSDLCQSKAERLCGRAQAHFEDLRLMPVVGTIGQAARLRGADNPLQRLIVGVDSRRARRSIQLEFPREVFDASTTDIREIVLHFNRQPTDRACLSCIYPENEREVTHQHHVAEALGVDVEEVHQEFVSEAVATKIVAAYPALNPRDLVGRAFDSLFKELCGQGVLRSAEGRQVLAPFAFVSVLAGTYLAIETIRRCSLGTDADTYNYWRASPWHSPTIALRQQRGRLEHCEFCGNKTFRTVNRQRWGASHAEA